MSFNQHLELYGCYQKLFNCNYLHFLKRIILPADNFYQNLIVPKDTAQKRRSVLLFPAYRKHDPLVLVSLYKPIRQVCFLPLRQTTKNNKNEREKGIILFPCEIRFFFRRKDRQIGMDRFEKRNRHSPAVLFVCCETMFVLTAKSTSIQQYSNPHHHRVLLLLSGWFPNEHQLDRPTVTPSTPPNQSTPMLLHLPAIHHNIIFVQKCLVVHAYPYNNSPPLIDALPFPIGLSMIYI